MFGLASGFYSSYFSPPTISILVIGCDGAGKTALLERCKATDFPRKMSTPNSATTTGGGGGISLQCRSGRNKRSSGPGGREGSGRSLAVDTSASAETKKSASSASSMTKRRPISTKAASSADKGAGASGGTSAGVRASNATATGGTATPSSEAERLLADAERRLPPEKRAELAAARASDRATSNGSRNVDPRENGGSGGATATTALPPPSSGRAMLPLSKIRPTVGMNLAKLDMFGAKCHLWDLGGRPMMRPLWERYYPDCDAVVFVVDGTLLSRASTGYDDFLNGPRSRGRTDDADDGVDRFGETREVFEGVRREGILADVPILAFVNKADEVTAEEDDVRRTARRSLFQRGGRPGGRSFNEGDLHYQQDDEEADEVDDEEDLIRVLVGSAKTGAGVTVAMEWLVRVAIANRPR